LRRAALRVPSVKVGITSVAGRRRTQIFRRGWRWWVILLWRWKSWLWMATRTIRAQRTVSSQIVLTCNPTDMFSGAGRAKLAKAAFVIGTLDAPFLWMGIETLISRRAVPVLGEPPAFRHASQVVLVQKLACIALLAEAAEPMLAYGCESFAVSGMYGQLLRGLKVENRGDCVSERAEQGT